MFLSQQGEDILLFLHYINQRVDDGVMIELGGVDGITYSNTFIFEKLFNFKTILIEPQSHMYEKLIINRPSSKCYKCAISDISGDIEFIGNNPCGGIVKHMNENHRERWLKGQTSFMVPTNTLNRICEENSVKHIDLLSVDVEGGELDVLKTLDFSKIEVYIVCIELDSKNKEKDDECRRILIDAGFRLEHRLCINEFWINSSYSKKDRLFKKETRPNFTRVARNKHSNLGKHPFMETHIIDTINEYLISSLK
jgi:FkbM family methyltransferase